MFTPKGKFAWYELMTNDTAAAGKFYSDVVGWTTQAISSPDGQTYTAFNLGQTGIAGMVSVPGQTGWLGYLSVVDVEAHIPKVIAAGGSLLRPVQDVPGMLRFAVMADPQGAAIVLFTPAPAMPANPGRPVAPTPGTLGWHELYTPDVEASTSFYNQLFGWTTISDLDMGSHGIYRIFAQTRPGEDDHKEMGDGGMMTQAPGIPVPCWNFYFNVESIGAAVERVRTGGGTIKMGPHQVAGGALVILATDPQGAMFSLVSQQP